MNIIKSIVVLVAVIAVEANAHECGFLSVRDFGAKGDGVTDDTAAIQSGLDYLAVRGGGKLYFPFTTNGYLIASPAKYTEVSDPFVYGEKMTWFSGLRETNAPSHSKHAIIQGFLRDWHLRLS